MYEVSWLQRSLRVLKKVLQVCVVNLWTGPDMSCMYNKCTHCIGASTLEVHTDVNLKTPQAAME